MSTAGKLTLTTFLTLDGVMQAPGGPNEDTSGDFPHGGWLVPYFDDEMGQIVDRAFGRADAFLLGRKTYEIFANHWPRVTDPRDVIAATLNRQPKYVASRTLKHLEWHNSRLIQEDVAERVAGLKQEYRREIQVHGSGELAQTLLANDLVDEFHLWLFPVVLGSGKRLFSRGAIPASLALAGTRKTSTGVVVNSYQRVGKPAYGSFALEA